MIHPPQHKYHTLDGARGVAALFVLTRHASPFFSPFAFRHSYLAVDVFFALSGFVLASAYDEKLRDGTLSAWAFMRIRFVRLWPLFALASSIAFLVEVARVAAHRNTAWSLPQLAATFSLSLAMLPSPFAPGAPHSSLFPLNGPSWSLLMEVIVNFLYAAFRARLTTAVLLGTMSASGVALAWCSLHFSGLGGGADWGDAVVGLPRVLYAFAAGMILHRLRLFLRLPRFTGMNVASAFFLGLVALTLGADPSPGIDPYYDLIVSILVVPTLILIGSSIEPGPKPARVCAIMGLASYSVYILQVPMTGLLFKAFRFIQRDASWGAPVTGLGLALCLVLLSLFLDRHFDQPLRRRLKRALQPAA